MTFLRLIFASLVHHWRTSAAVALGVAAATAVLTGALVVGDSVRGSLRHLTLDRLGRIDEALIVDRFFREELAAELAADSVGWAVPTKSPAVGGAHPTFHELYASAQPAILFPSATVQTQGGGSRRLAAGVTVLGTYPAFWSLGDAAHKPKKAPGTGEIILNAPLAEELAAKVGDSLVVRFGKADQIPADSPLGRRADRVASLAELKVIEIIPAESLGRFGLAPSQVAPRNAYVALPAVQEALKVAGKVNAILVGGRDPEHPAPPAASQALAGMLRPRLTDDGLALKHVRMTFGEGPAAKTISDYYSLSSDRMLLDPATERVAREAFADLKPQAVLTYLANRIEKVTDNPNDRPTAIPYSTIAAIDPAPGGPLVDSEGQPLPPLANDEIVLTSWAANDQQAQVGDEIRVTYFEPETTHGTEREATAVFRVKAIVPLVEPKRGFSRRGPAVYDQPPSPANDPDLTPEVKGITDQASIADWEAPFPFDYKAIRPQDDEFWNNHRTTPKAYVSLAAGQKLWGSRFGRVTSFRIPAGRGRESIAVSSSDNGKSLPQSTPDPVAAESLEKQFLAEAARSGQRLGFDFLPVKRQGLAASGGTTPFDVLFLLLSMFLIAAAILLVWLLFRLGVEQRASEIGLWLALGWTRQKVRRLLVLEGAVVAAIGAALGVAAGVGYAWLMLAGLSTWWLGAIASPFLTLHMTQSSLLGGFLIGLGASVLTIWFSLGRVKKAVVRALLAGEIVAPSSAAVPRTQYSVLSTENAVRTRGPTTTLANFQSPLGILIFVRTHPAKILFYFALALTIFSAFLGGEAQAGALLTAGAAILVALLLVVTEQLRSAGQQVPLLAGSILGRLAFRNASRNVGRSTATIALMASASFLIVAVSAFRMSPTSAGVGGFDLIAESSLPIFENLNSTIGRDKLLAKQAKLLEGSTVLALRLKAGDDASCRNLYQPSQPRVLGVTPQMIAYFDDPHLPARFGWSASAAKTREERANPWRLLSSTTTHDSPLTTHAIPVVLDQNTAMYSLRLYGGVGQQFDVTYADGTKVTFRVAGLLANSVLQGSLLIGEADFQRLFPQTSGYRSFLIRTPKGKAAEVAAALEDRLGDEGFDAVDARARLADLLAVQNTYISTFQTLGALGLVLGTFGVASVQLRSVFERRKELALMRAAGFRRERLGEMVLLENLLLLVGGLAVGTIAALVTILPQMYFGGARVPLFTLAVMLLVVLLVGLATGLIAVRATLRAPLMGALRGE